MSLTKSESEQVEALLPPISEYEGLFSDKEHLPRENPTVLPRDTVTSFTSLRSEVDTQENELPPANLREYAIQQGYIAVDNTLANNLVTIEQAVLHYGQEAAKEQGMNAEFVNIAEGKIDGLMDSSRPAKLIDPLTLSVGVLSLAKMEQAEDDPERREAVSKAFEAIPKDPEELELLRRQAAISHDTGELIVQAILEHEAIGA
jgi:hypothetical protein